MPNRPASKTAEPKEQPPTPAEADPPVAPTDENRNGGGHPTGPDYPGGRPTAIPRRQQPDGPWYDDEGLDPLDLTIHQALAMMQAELPVVARAKTANIEGRDGRVSYSYSYADLADIAEAVKPLLARYGLSFVCTPRRVDTGTYELVGRLMHVSGDEVEGALPIQGRNAQDIGSAITYARRYLLGCLTGLVTDDDDDGRLAARAEPTTEQLLARLDALARSQETDREQITAKWREQRGGIPVEVLDMLAPTSLRPLVDAIESWIQAQAAMRGASTPSGQ